jgi:hypothetical protein
MAIIKIQPYSIDNSKDFEFKNVTYTGNVVSLNANLGNAVTANYFIGNGSLLTGLPASYSDSNVATYLPNYTGNLKAANLSVTTSANLGAVGNITITGGTSGYVLQTDGAGNLTWTAQTGGGGGGTPGGANSQVQFNSSGTFAGSSGFTYNSSTTTLTANNISISTSAALGAASNVHITGGTTGQVLTTDGAGNLTWATVIGAPSQLPVLTTTVDTFTANGAGNTYTLTVTPDDKNHLVVNLDGVLQLKTSYSVSGAVLTMNGTPVNGAVLEVTTIAGSVFSLSGLVAGANTQVQFNDSGSAGASANLTFNKSTSTLNATNITANGTPVATTGKAIAMSIVFGG